MTEQPPPPESPAAAAASVTAKLAGKYRERKLQALSQIDGLTPRIEAGDADAIETFRGVAHGLSGVCGAFGEPTLGELANAAEDLARQGDRPLADLNAAVARLRAGLSESLAGAG